VAFQFRGVEAEMRRHRCIHLHDWVNGAGIGYVGVLTSARPQRTEPTLRFFHESLATDGIPAGLEGFQNRTIVVQKARVRVGAVLPPCCRRQNTVQLYQMTARRYVSSSTSFALKRLSK